MSTSARPRMTGIGRVLVIVYAIMALAATGRSLVQIIERYEEAPLAYTLSALSALVYILATLALIFSGSRGWYRVAWIAIVAPFAGNPPTGSLLEFWVYLVSAVLLPPAAVFWALLERSRWSTVIMGVAALSVAVMVWRMQVIWTIQVA